MGRLRRRLLLITGVLLAALLGALPARAQAPVVGVLAFAERSQAFQDAFRQGLRDHGYAEGRNIAVEWRWAEGNAERADALAAELVALKVRVIVAVLTPAVRAASKATAAIPIVMAPAGPGFVKNLARPEGNITGISGFSAELSGKRLEILRELVPGLRRVAVLLNRADPVFAKNMRAETEEAARKSGIGVQAVTVGTPGEIEAAFAAMAKEKAAAIIQPSLVVPSARAAQVAKLAVRNRVALASQSAEFVEAGGLMAYGANFRELYRYTAVYVHKLLAGAKPGELPVERASRTELSINAGTAKALGLRPPISVLMRADRVIE